MWQTIDLKAIGALHRFEDGAAAFPLQIYSYCLAVGILAGLFCYWLYRGKYRHTFWCLAGFVAVQILAAVGEDTIHHAMRVASLSDQIRHGWFSLLVTDPATGNAFPIFLYYSALPYIIPVALSLAGISTLASLAIAMAMQWLVFAAGVDALIELSATKFGTEKPFGSLAGALFLTATYVFGLWLVRAALGELWVYSLAPWVVRAALAPQSMRSLTILLFLQVCAHPLVFLQSTIGEAIVAVGLAQEAAVKPLIRGAIAVTVAVVMAFSFWLPQLIWLRAVVGNAAIPERFISTFLSLREFVDLRFNRNIGIWLPCAIIFMIAGSRLRLSLYVVTMAVAFITLAAMQTVYLSRLSANIPIINESQFIWRLMFPTAFVGFGALLAGWNASIYLGRPALVLLTILSAGWMTGTQFAQAPGDVQKQASIHFVSDGYWFADRHIRYFTRDNVWGLGPFMPDYSRLESGCALINKASTWRVSFAQLRTGLRSQARFISMEDGPVEFVTYKSNGQDLPERACGDRLVLGPLLPNNTIRVDEGRLNAVLVLRLTTLLAIVLVLFAWKGIIARFRSGIRLPVIDRSRAA